MNILYVEVKSANNNNGLFGKIHSSYLASVRASLKLAISVEKIIFLLKSPCLPSNERQGCF